MRVFLIAAWWSLTAFAAAETVGAAAEDVAPFRATYGIAWRGFNAGSSELDLQRTSDGQYVYTSRSNATGLFHAFFSNEITQTSWLTIGPDGVRPDRYRGDDGSKKTERDIALDFDWNAMRVTGVAEDKPVDLELEPQTHDAMSIQIALVHALLKGEKPAAFRLVDKNRIKDYAYKYEGDAHMKTALGEVDTVIWTSQRSGSTRMTRMWYAPSLGYVAVKGEQLRDNKREWQMEIRTLQR